jgi:hypothetical protein
MVLAGVLVFVALSYAAGLRAARGRVYRTTVRPKVVDDMFGRAKTGIIKGGQRARSRRRTTTRPNRSSDDATIDIPQEPTRRQP